MRLAGRIPTLRTMGIAGAMAIGCAAPLLVVAGSAEAAASLVTEDTIKEQRTLTKVHRLKNGIPVVLRSIPTSDILQVSVGFHRGLRDLPQGKKILNRWLFETMPMAAEGFPKQKVFSLTEKYALELDCGGGIEMSVCMLGTVNDTWRDALPLFSAIVRKPSFKTEDANLARERLEADLRTTPENPQHFVNEVVNRVFYGGNHPYWHGFRDGLKELSTLKPKALIEYHRELLDAGHMGIVVVGSFPEKDMLADLEREFGSIPALNAKRPPVVAPPFDKARNIEIEDRAIPTAYILAKVNAPGVTAKDGMATRLMFDILDSELSEEIRTKRSLSYAVYSHVIQYEQGIGIIGASTSNPRETLEAMDLVIKMVKTKPYTVEELEERKHVFATDYFLTQESHTSLAGALGTYLHYFGRPERMYEVPREIERVTPQDIQRLASEILVNLRVGVLYDKKKFDEQWAKTLIEKNLKP